MMRIVLLLVASALLLPAQLRVSTAEAMEAAVVKPIPAYNPVAKQMKVSGEVLVEVEIDPEGNVSNATPTKGNVLLSQPAANTVKKWKFKPFQQNGAPTAAVTTLKFNFTM
jgi:TonB family protein